MRKVAKSANFTKSATFGEMGENGEIYDSDPKSAQFSLGIHSVFSHWAKVMISYHKKMILMLILMIFT